MTAFSTEITHLLELEAVNPLNKDHMTYVCDPDATFVIECDPTGAEARLSEWTEYRNGQLIPRTRADAILTAGAKAIGNIEEIVLEKWIDTNSITFEPLELSMGASW